MPFLTRNSLPLSISPDRLYAEFFQEEAGYNSWKMAFLDRTIERSPYRSDVSSYGDRLKQCPSLYYAGCKNYSPLKERPKINERRLDFLHPDIKNACICIGGSAGGAFKAQWLGRNALDKVEFWSATKFLQVINALTQVTGELEGAQIGDSETVYPLMGAINDLVSYAETYGSSNAIAAAFKCFQTYADLETWVKELSGQEGLDFQGLYGEEPFTAQPQITRNGEVLLSAVDEVKSRATQPGENSIPAYVLTRILSMVGWHHHLSSSARIPGLGDSQLALLVPCLGRDCARYVDVAIAKLGIQIQNPVILSKMGFGRSSYRDRTELTYSCFVQFEYRGQLKSLTMTLRAGKDLGDGDREAVELDARMATEVTQIIQRLVLHQL
ncbi:MULTISPECIES: hypothetical protein [unclassified Roseofilum]|uniref:hypothetical protein n=1 Tax=unclassified Roseofilum TaxID=2620099 RepID=UPI000E7DE69D|nr:MULTISPECIES: hypothetical protein [unclassified Roseofilum]MBP0007573.1 hypothetical protein [Roseofilum sp. Belize Diploria]MBP0033945.1 hypothetical protein [Roseofilum sp. Belize BBD 4]HBQ97933.1 hypothetical protein [Cyanobacteria bacterium UBA11691]